MADNLTTQSATLATIPASSVIATDDAGAGGHVQIIKLAQSADGSASPITADANGLLVNLGANNDMTLATLPDTAAGDLAAINAALGGTLTISGTVTANAGTGTFTVDGSGVTQPISAAALPLPSGASTAANQSTANSSLGNIEAGFAAEGAALGSGVLLQGDDGTDRTNVLVDVAGHLQIDVLTSALPSGAASAANQTTIIGHVDGIEALLTTIDADTSTLSGAVSGTEMQVDVVAALPAGTNLIGDVVVNDIEDGAGTSVMDAVNNAVQVNVVAGSTSGTEYTEDAAAPANPDAPAVALVRADTPATIASTDGDWVAQRATNYGAAFVQVLDSSGNFINTFGGSGGTAATDDTAFTAGSGQGTPAMGFFSADTVDAGDVGVLAMDASRRLLVSIEVDNVGIGGGTQYAIGTVAGATDTGTAALAIRDDALSTLADAAGDWVGLRVDANGALWVIPSGTVTVDGSGVTQPVSGTITANLSATDNAVLDSIDAAVNGTLTVGSHAVTNAGTFAVQVDGAALTALQLIDNIVQVEDAVHGTGDSGVMALAVRNDTLAALAGTDGDYSPLQVNASGALFIQEGSALDVSAATVTVTGTVTANAGTGTFTVDGSGVTQPVSGTVTANLSATDNAVLDTIETNTDFGTVTGGGVEATALRVTLASDSTGVLSVDDNGGSLTIDGTVTASNTAGDIAHDAADSGNPVKVGGVAYNFDGTAPGTAVAEGDRAEFATDVYGRQLVETAHPNLFTATGNYSTAQTDASVEAAPGAGLSLYVTDVVLTTDTAMNIELEAGATDIVPPMYFAANGGAAMHFTTPIKLAANTALTITSSASGNHSVLVNGYIAP